MTMTISRTSTSAARVQEAFRIACNTADVDAAIGLYESTGLLVMNGEEFRGNIKIRAALQDLFALGGTMEMHDTELIEAGDVAIARTTWTLDVPDRGEGPMTMQGRTNDVLRCQPDGSWLVVIDDPFGGGR